MYANRASNARKKELNQLNYTTKTYVKFYCFDVYKI